METRRQHTITFAIPDSADTARLLGEMEETCHVAVQTTREYLKDASGLTSGVRFLYYVKHTRDERIAAVRDFCAAHGWTVTGYEE